MANCTQHNREKSVSIDIGLGIENKSQILGSVCFFMVHFDVMREDNWHWQHDPKLYSNGKSPFGIGLSRRIEEHSWWQYRVIIDWRRLPTT